MKTIEIPKIGEMRYPVGTYMTSNKPVIKKLIKAFKEIEEFKGKYVNIICRGSSGAIIGSMFSVGIPNDNRIVYVKKEGETSHSDCYADPRGVNLIVDDFICTGRTINAIYKHFKDNIVVHCLCASSHSDKIERIDFKPHYFICAKDH